MNYITNEPAGIDLDNAALDKLEAHARSKAGHNSVWLSASKVLALIALARRAPAPVMDERALRQAGKDFYNATVADSEVRITSASKEKRDIAAAAADRLRAALAQQSPAPVVAHDAPQEAAPSLLSEAYRAVQNCILALPDGQFKRDMDEWLTVRLDLIDGPDAASAISGLRPVASVVSRVGDDLRVGWLRPERCDVGTLLYCAAEPEAAGIEGIEGIAASPASRPVAPEAAHADDRQDMAREEMLELCRHNPVSACGLPLKAAHAQQEAAPAEVTKSQERDYNWLLGLAKSKGYQTVYGALYAAPTAVPYLGILPSHSEREAANAGGRIIVPEWVYRSARDLAVSIWRDNYKDTAPQWEPLDDLAGVVSQIDNMVTGMRRVTGAGNRPEITDDELVAFNRFCECAEDFDSGGHDVPKEMMKRLAVIGLVRPCGFGRHETTLFGDAVRNGNAPATIAAGQEAANAKDAARPIPDAECAQGSCARGKDGCRGRCCLAGHKLPIVADIDSAAMAAVGAAGQEGGDHG